MGASSLWSLAGLAPPNLLAVVLVDGHYTITGGQPLGVPDTFGAVAAALGLATATATRRRRDRARRARAGRARRCSRSATTSARGPARRRSSTRRSCAGASRRRPRRRRAGVRAACPVLRARTAHHSRIQPWMCVRISCLRAVGVTRGDGARDRVDLVGDRPRSLVGGDRGAMPAQHGLVDAERDPDPQAVLGRARERLVPADVDLGDVGRVASAAAARASSTSASSAAQVAAVGAARGPGGVLALEVDAELRQVLERGAAQVHERRQRVADGRLRRRHRVGAAALARADLDDPDRLQRAQRLAQRRPPDAELLAQLALAGQPLAGPDAARSRSPRAAARRRRRTSGRAGPCRNAVAMPFGLTIPYSPEAR